MQPRELADANRENLNAARAQGRTHFELRSSHQLWLHPDTGQVVRADRLTGEQLERAECIGHETVADPCPVDRYELLRAPLVLKRMKSLSQTPPVRRSGHAPRPATNTRRRGSRRMSARLRAGPDDDPSEPAEHLEPPRAVAEVPVRGERRTFLATVCVVDGQLVYPTGRWRQRTGPDYVRVQFSVEANYMFSAAEIERIRWLEHELAALDHSAEIVGTP